MLVGESAAMQDAILGGLAVLTLLRDQTETLSKRLRNNLESRFT
jgi:hypothetical protein